MMALRAEAGRFGKVFSNADSNFSCSEANTDTCACSAVRLAGDSVGVATAAEECDCIGVVVVVSGALLKDWRDWDTGVPLKLGLPCRLDSSSCARLGRADIFAITEDPAAGSELPSAVRCERVRDIAGDADRGGLWKSDCLMIALTQATEQGQPIASNQTASSNAAAPREVRVELGCL